MTWRSTCGKTRSPSTLGSPDSIGWFPLRFHFLWKHDTLRWRPANARPVCFCGDDEDVDDDNRDGRPVPRGGGIPHETPLRPRPALWKKKPFPVHYYMMMMNWWWWWWWWWCFLSVLTVGLLGASTVILTLNSYVGEPIQVFISSLIGRSARSYIKAIPTYYWSSGQWLVGSAHFFRSHQSSIRETTKKK